MRYSQFTLFVISVALLLILILTDQRAVVNCCAIQLAQKSIYATNEDGPLASAICKREFIFQALLSLALVYEPVLKTVSHLELAQFRTLGVQNPIMRLRLGMRLWEHGDRESALAEWRASANIDVYFADRSVSAIGQGDVAEAQRMGEIAQTIEPTLRSEK